MYLYLYDDEKIITFSLPSKKIGNFWMTDDNNKNIVNISVENGDWIMSGAENTKIITNGNSEKVILRQNYYYIVEKNEKRYVLYAGKLNDETFEYFIVPDNSSVKIGKSANNEISINLPYFADTQLILNYEARSVI